MIYQRVKYFLKAAKEGSFKKAAEQMYVSPQALTKQIGLLEEELGGRLFERSPKGIRLTRLGEAAQQRLGKADEEFQSALNEIKLLAHNSKEQLRIGIFSALPQDTMVTPLVSFLLSSFPQYQIALELIALNEGRKLLMEGKIDIFLTNTHEEDDWEGYQCLSFGEYDTKVIVSLRHPWAVKEHITVEDMKQETFLKMIMDNSCYTVCKEESFYENIPCRNIQSVANFDTLYALLQQGKAFAVFPLAFLYMDRAKIKAFDFPGRTLVFHTALVYSLSNPLVGLNEVVHELEEEFDLKPISQYRHPGAI